MSMTRQPPGRNYDVKTSLAEAKAHFYAREFPEAYQLLRRFFDRLPFQPEPEHGEYIGMYARVLGELGKTSELKFYLVVLENAFERTRDAALGYALAVTYRFIPDPRPEGMRKTLELILAGTCDDAYRARAKMLLAHYYEWAKEDLGMVREVIASMKEPEDPSLKHLWHIWRAKVAKDQGQFREAEDELLPVLHGVTLEQDWYVYFSARVILASLSLAQGERPRALTILKELRALFQKKNLKTLKIHLNDLEARIRRRPPLPKLTYRTDATDGWLENGKKRIYIKGRTPMARVLRVLVSKPSCSKGELLREAVGKGEIPEAGDQFVYHLIHSIREKLEGIGLERKVLQREGDRYRLLAEIHLEKE